MELDRIDPAVFQEMERKGKESEGVLSDPHLYLCLVFMGILLVMSLFACSHVGPVSNADATQQTEAPKQEAGAVHK